MASDQGGGSGEAARAIVLIASASSSRGGGPFTSVRRLWAELAKLGWAVEVHTLEDRSSDEDRRAWSPLTVAYHRQFPPRRFGPSPAFWRHVDSSVRGAARAGDRVLISSHGLWMFTDLAGYLAQRRYGAARIVHPHGMLEPWALRRSRVSKLLAGIAWQRRSLLSADALRASSSQEVESFGKAGYRRPTVMIPHGIDVPDEEAGPPSAGDSRFVSPGVRNLLFLSRIHPSKGLPTLLRAWARLAASFPQWRLVIAGPDGGRHERDVRELAAQLALREQCSFVGPAYGRDKAEILRSADVFVLPSYSEGFGMAVAEALAAGIPVVTTTSTPWSRVAEKGCGWWVPAEVEALAGALRAALGQPAPALRAMGQRGRAWMVSEFNWTAIAKVADGAFRQVLAGSPAGSVPASCS